MDGICRAHCACGPYPSAQVVQPYLQPRANDQDSTVNRKPSTDSSHATDHGTHRDAPADDVPMEVGRASMEEVADRLSRSLSPRGESSLHSGPSIDRAQVSTNGSGSWSNGSQKLTTPHSQTRMSLDDPFISPHSSVKRATSDSSRKSTARSQNTYSLECGKPDCLKNCICNKRGKVRCQGFENLGPRLRTQFCRLYCECKIDEPQKRTIAAQTAYGGTVFAHDIPSASGSAIEALDRPKQYDPTPHRDNSTTHGDSKFNATGPDLRPSLSNRDFSDVDPPVILYERGAPSSRKASPTSEAATRSVALRQGLIPWCGDMLGRTHQMCINYCACDSRGMVHCSQAKGKAPIEQQIYARHKLITGNGV